MQNKLNHSTKAFVLFYCLLGCLMPINAQVPIVKNPANGKVIDMMSKAPVVSAAKANKNVPVATKVYNLPGGGTKTVRLLRGNDSELYSAREGNASPTSSTPGKTCVSTPINGELSGIDASNLNPSTQSIFPGSIIDGMTIPTGEYRQITAARNPVLISLSSNNNGLSASSVVETPNLATIREAVDNMLGVKKDGRFDSETSDQNTMVVRTEEEVNLALNAHFKNLNLVIDFTGSFTENANEMTLIRIYRERTFSVDVVPPTNDVDFFQNPATVISPNWTYVSSVKYGRIGVLKIKITTKEREMSAALKGEYTGGFSASGNFSASLKNKTQSISVQFYRYGGSNVEISTSNINEVPTVLQAFSNWITNGNTNPQPLAYTLNFVKYENGGPSVALINSILKFSERKCKAQLPRYEVTLKEIKCLGVDDGGDDRPGEDIYGILRVKAFNGNKQAIRDALGKEPEVWKDQSDCGRSVKMGSAIPVQQTRYFDVDPDDNQAQITIGGDINDDDNCGILNTGEDDDLGDNKGALTTKDIFLRTIGTTPSTILINHKSGGSHIQQVWILKKTLQ
jgi:thiol-activated cytolysin